MTAQDILLNKYGIPDEHYQAEFCIVWEVQKDFPWFPISHIYINKDFKDLLFKAFTALQAANLHTEIKTFDGCYNDRTVRGSSSTSLHAWCAAIDINASTNGMVVNPTDDQRRGTWTQAFIDTMVGAGVYFGGNFKRRADPMHWALYDG